MTFVISFTRHPSPPINLADPFGCFPDLDEFTVNGRLFLLFAILVNYFFDLLLVSLQIRHNLVIRPLVATLAQTARVMRAVLVRALCCLLLVSFHEVAEMAQELCTMLAIVVLACAHGVQIRQYRA